MPDTQAFLAHLIIGNYSENSIKDIVSTLRFFQKKYNFTKEDINRFIVDCKLRRIKVSTINKYIANIKVYANYLQLSCASEIKGLRGTEEVNKIILSTEEIQTFLDLPKYSGAERWDEWNLFWRILAYTGCRPNEAANLKDTDIDLGLAQIYIRQTKTKVARVAPIHPDLLPFLKNIGEGYICNFSKTAWVQHFNRRLRRCGVKKRPGLTAYSFRHTVATSLLDADKNVYLVKNLLGHKKTSTTEKYYNYSTKKLQNLVSALPYASSENRVIANINLIKELAQKSGVFGIDQKETNKYYSIKIFKS